MTRKPLLGQILIADGAVEEETLARALGYQRATRQSFRLGSILLDWDLLGEDKLLEALSKLHRSPAVTWAELSRTGPEALQFLSPSFAMRLGAFPFAIDGSALRVAFRNPSDLSKVDEVSSVCRKRLIPGVTTEAALVLAYHRFYGRPVPADFKDLVQRFNRGLTTTPARARTGKRHPPVPSAAPDSRRDSREHPSSAPVKKRPAAPGVDGPETLPAEDPGLASVPAAAAASMPQAVLPQAAPAREPDVEIDLARICESVMQRLLEIFPRVLVLGVGKSAIRGWTGRGPGLTPEIVAELRVRSAGESVIPDVARSGQAHVGPLQPERLSFGLRGMLDKEAPGCAVFPIRIAGAVTGILYADRLGDPMLDGDSALLSDAAQTLARLFSESGLPADHRDK